MLLVLAIWYTFQEGEIFGFVSVWGDQHIHYKLQPPLYECNVCMTPWYGSVLYWVIPWQHVLWHWPVVVIVAMGLNAALNKLQPQEPDHEE